MNKKDTLRDLPLSERLDILKANSIAVKKHSYLREFSAEELADMQEGMLDDLIESRRLAAVFQTQRDDHREVMKAIDKRIDSAVISLRDKAHSCTEECFVLADMDAGTATYYSSSDGRPVFTRPLDVSERQQQLPNVTRMAM
jgi:hypothetical protein